MAGRAAKKHEHIGGQAVIEGVMMKNADKVAVAVRKPNNKISVKRMKYRSIARKKGLQWLGWPFFRGIIVLIETLVLGIKALSYSANESLGEEEEKISTKEMVLTILFAMLVAVGFFIVLPLYLTKLTQTQGILFNLIDGLIRVALFVAYVVGISFMKDIKRIFQYHGAEHKAVNCHEAGLALNYKNAKQFTTVHSRCGTTFILIVLVISIIIFSLIISENFWIKLAGRILLMPVIAGIAYELLRLSARYERNMILRALSAPGMWLQKITTREPNKKQLEVAIAALKKVL